MNRFGRTGFQSSTFTCALTDRSPALPPFVVAGSTATALNVVDGLT